MTVSLLAGNERAIAVTKTYTPELAALASLAASLGARVRAVADAIRQVVLPALDRARRAGAAIGSFGNAAGLVDGVAGGAQAPAALLPVLSPILSIVPGQPLADSLARARGLDPDRPPSLTKVTLAP